MFGPSYFGPSHYGPTYFPPGELVETVTGGGWFNRGDLFDIRDLGYLYEPQEPVIEVVEKAGEDIDIDVEYTPPDVLMQASPIEFRAPPVSEIPDPVEREIAILIRKIEIAKHATRAIRQAEKENLFRRNLQAMIILMLDDD